MTDFKNNLEEVWNQEYKDFMLSFYPESSPLVSTWEIYRMAKIKSQKEIKNLLELTETLNQIRDILQDENRKLEQELQKKSNMLAKVKSYFGISVRKNSEMRQELQKTREYLGKAIKSAEFFMSHADCKKDSWACKCSFCRDTESSKNLREARQYFKDKQGE